MISFTLPKDSDCAIIYDEINRKQYLIERCNDVNSYIEGYTDVASYLVISPISDKAIIKATKER